ncbi:MAG: rRNA pseudouridine synthase [Acholeplasmatales bacterium]|nr:rRNA pseudouridine synthase [Acholeplasmatales bacterium]
MMRLDKLLSHSNYGTRKEVKQLIRKGFVLVNGEVILDDDFKVDEEKDEIVIANNEIKWEKYIYIMLNKPDGYVSATYDNFKPTVISLIEGYDKRNIFPVGRLDIDTEGLLLITNDGMLAHKLLSPKSHVDKKYYVEFEGEYKESFKDRFKEGIILDDGYKCLPAKINYLGDNKCEVIIREGKFHQVKRMFEALGSRVIYLKRIEFGSLVLDNNLKLGEYRALTEEEIKKLIEN